MTFFDYIRVTSVHIRALNDAHAKQIGERGAVCIGTAWVDDLKIVCSDINKNIKSGFWQSVALGKSIASIINPFSMRAEK